MRKKLKVQVPILILETIERDSKFFGITKEKLCNEILFKFALRYRSNYQEELIFEKKKYLQFNLNKENQNFYEGLIKGQIGISDSEIIREIFSGYVALIPLIREKLLFREKIAFITTSLYEYRTLKIEVPDGIIEGRIEEISRCNKNGNLKILLNKKEYYISQTRIIS